MMTQRHVILYSAPRDLTPVPCIMYHPNSWYEAKVRKTPSPELCMSSYNSTFNASQSSGHGNFATGKSTDERPVCTWVVCGLLGSLGLSPATTGRHLGRPVVSLPDLGCD